MRIKIILVVVISISCTCQIIGQGKKDSTKYKRPDVGFAVIIPVYTECADGISPRPNYAYPCDMLLEWKPAIDSFIWVVEVHTDCRDDSSYNAQTTQTKADSIVAYLKRKSHDRMMVTGKGMGESQLVNDCKCEGEVIALCDEIQHQQNRRMVLRIVGRKEF